jgi:hypothetical protein
MQVRSRQTCSLHSLTGGVQRLYREIDVWKKVWDADKGRYTLLIIGFSTISFHSRGQREP